MPTLLDLNGVRYYPGYLGPARQESAVEAVRAVATRAPFRRQTTRRGQALSVRMTAAGNVGWTSDRRGYRYEELQPDGVPWPPIPELFLEIWRELSGAARMPDSALFNYYGEGARMGLHQDRDEADTSLPVVSISLGDHGLFRVGGLERGGPTISQWLRSGDVTVMGGDARLVHHGVDRIRFGSSTLLDKGGRLNVTLRCAV